MQTKVEEINQSLKDFFSNAEFHDRALLTYPKKEEKNTVFMPVNNYSGDEKEIYYLQAFLSRVILDRFAPLELPSSWLLFHLAASTSPTTQLLARTAAA